MSRTDGDAASLLPRERETLVWRGADSLKPDLRELLEDRVVIGDGAMGTLLGERGVGFGHPYARANLSHPEMVTNIHQQYIRAGATVVETNTFSANRYKLENHHLEDRVRQDRK